jgi:hypothetical protein
MNKILVSSFICSPLLLMAACSSPKFQYAEYRGKDVIEAKGGNVRAVDGIEIWTDGAPKQKFKIIGIIAESRRGGHGRGPLSSLMPGSSTNSASIDAAVVKLVKSHGGDAVIIVVIPEQKNSEDDFFADESDNDSSGASPKKHRPHLQGFVIKYVK